jgi:inosine-uridine nucleoside N-ribohydrolase
VGTPIVLDCDPGHDDAIALLLALASPELELLGVTTTYGNQTLEKTTTNALRVLELVGRGDVPVAAGADRPLERELVVAAHVHGESGLDGPALPEASGAPASDDAVAFIAERLGAARTPVTLVATGPLTNVARYLATHGPSGVDRIVLMGGAIAEGNFTPAAEFNIWCDPEAAAAVFASGLDVTMMGLDVTHQAILLPPAADRLRGLGTKSAAVAAELVDYALAREGQWYGTPRMSVHDAVAVAHLAIGDLVAVAEYDVQVDTGNGPARGRTVCDGLPVRIARKGRTPNAQVGIRIDRDRFEDVLVDAYARLP